MALGTWGAEDLIVFKAFAGREKDWLDIEGIAIHRSGQLDETVIWAEPDPPGYVRSRGSMASRTASPKRLRPNTAMAIAEPGKIASHGALRMFFCAS